jgi:methanogenic corrinoid protein MtbC1
MGGELHEMGLRFVSDYFKLNGWEVIFFGANTPKNAILNEIEKLDPAIVAISATTSNQIYTTKLLIEEIRELNLKSKILVGGYVFNADPKLFEYVDADDYAPNAEGAVQIANKMITN